MKSVDAKRAARTLALAALSVVALLLASCSAPATEEAGTKEGISRGSYGGDTLALGQPTSGGDFRFGMLVPVENLDSTGSIGGSSEFAMQQVYDRLMKVNSDGEAVPELAESLTTDDNTVWTMTLPEGVTFHDGTPFDAQAVITHLQNVASEGSTSLQASDARAIASMDAPDDLTVVFKLKRPSNQFGLNFAFGSMAMIPSPTAYEAGGDEFGLAPVGAGPFKVESFTPGGDIVYSKNSDYWADELPYLDTMTFVSVADESSRLAAVQSGDLDAATLPVPAKLKEAEEGGLTVLDQPWYSYSQLTLNLQSPGLDDIRIRRAINLAVKRDALNEVAYGGLAKTMGGSLVPDHPYFDHDAGWPSEFDPEKATALVDEYVADTGETPNFHMYINEWEEHKKTAALLQQMLGAVGIELNYEVATPTTQITAAMGGDFDILLQDQGVPPETTSRFNQLYRTDAILNLGHGGNPDLDALLDKAANAPSPEDRLALIDPMQEVLAKWVPTVPLVTGTLGRVLGPRVQGFPDGVSSPTSQDYFEAKYVWVSE